VSTSATAGPMTGLWPVSRMTFRLARVRILAWVVLMTVLTVAVARAWDSLYPTAQGRLEFAAALQASPALTSLLGPLYDPVSTGGLTAWRLGSGMVLVLGLASIFLVVKHTRADESVGRTDLIRSARVGRASPTLAAFGAAAVIDLAFGATSAAALMLLGEAPSGAAAFGLSVAGGALVFASVGVLAAQAVSTSRAANGLASLVLAASFMAYAVGNADSDLDVIALATPFGWASRTRPFAGETWTWVLLLFAVAALLLVVGLVVSTRRDVGAALIGTRSGRRQAAPWLRSVTALAWRVDRGQLVTWVLAMLMLGVFVGYLAKTASDLLSSNPQLSQFLERLGGDAGVTDSYVLVMIAVLSFGSAAYAVSTLLRTHADEESGRLELLLSVPASRRSLLSSRALLVAGGVVVIQAAVGLGVGLSNGAANDDLRTLVPRYVAVALLAVPAVWVIAGWTVAVIGAVPRFTWLAWLALAYCVTIGELGPILGLPDWTLRTTPFWFTPAWPVEEMSVVPVVALVVVSLVLAAWGVLRFERRDIPG
jgi:ABC-2 type transport system permease protein